MSGYESKFLDAHDKVQFFWEAGRVLASQKEDYRSAIKLIVKALNVAKRSRIFDQSFKNWKTNELYGPLIVFSLNIGDLKGALRYAKLYKHPDYLGDVYFEMGLYEKCLDAYTDLNKPRRIFPEYVRPADEKISIRIMVTVVKAFFGLLNKKDGDKYNVEGLKNRYNWLFEQVVNRFSSLEMAFNYYHCKKPSTKSRHRKEILTKSQVLTEEKLKEWLQTFRKRFDFDRHSSDRIESIGNLINRSKFVQAANEMISLYKVASEIEKDTNLKSTLKYSLITDVADILLILHKFDKAISWIYKHLDYHWRMADYYLNIKFLLNQDITGEDLVALALSSEFRDSVATVIYSGFYTPSPFSIRHKIDITKICNKLYQEVRQSLGKPYLKYIYEEYVDEKLPLEQYGAPKNLYRHVHSLLDGRYGLYKLEKDIILPNIPTDIRLSKAIPHMSNEGSWIHIDFDGCEELIELISTVNFKAENQLRSSMGIPERGKGWASENEIYAYTKELLSDYEVKQHYSPPWLSPKHLDVYIPDLQIAIEYQGAQHYEPVNRFGGEEAFSQTQVRDKIKTKLCQEHNVKLLHVCYDDENTEKTIQDFIEKYTNEKG